MSHTSLLERSGRREHRKVRLTPWLRARVFFTHLKLDRALAGGADPSASAELRLRSEQLGSQKARERIGAGIERVLLMPQGERQPYLGPPRLPVDNRRVEPNVDRLEELAETLRSAHPHPVKGLAMASVLLEDREGPLYANDSAESLRTALDAILCQFEAEDADGRS